MVTVKEDYGMNYVEKSYDDLFKMYLDLAGVYGLIKNKDVDRGGVLMMEFAIHSKILQEQYKELTQIHESMDLKKAHNKELDILLEPLLLRRVDEDDESYRKRGQYWKEIQTRGTKKAVEDAIENVRSVRNYYIEACWDGPGTTRIIIDPHNTKTLKKVKEAVLNVCSLDMDITFAYAKEKPITIDLKVNIELEPNTIDKDRINTLIEEALKIFIEGNQQIEGIRGGLGLGKDFIPSQAVTYLINSVPGLVNVEIDSPISRVRIGPDEKAMLGELKIDTTINT
jgi:hypothetical protein